MAEIVESKKIGNRIIIDLELANYQIVQQVNPLNGWAGSNGRKVAFKLFNGRDQEGDPIAYNLDGKTVALMTLDAQGIPKISRLMEHDDDAAGEFTITVPAAFYQAVGRVKEGFIGVFKEDDLTTILGTMPITFEVADNHLLSGTGDGISKAFDSAYNDLIDKLISAENKVGEVSKEAANFEQIYENYKRLVESQQAMINDKKVVIYEDDYKSINAYSNGQQITEKTSQEVDLNDLALFNLVPKTQQTFFLKNCQVKNAPTGPTGNGMIFDTASLLVEIFFNENETTQRITDVKTSNMFSRVINQTANTFGPWIASNASLAEKATQLATARTIDGVPFDGSSDISTWRKVNVGRISSADNPLNGGVFDIWRQGNLWYIGPWTTNVDVRIEGGSSGNISLDVKYDNANEIPPNTSTALPTFLNSASGINPECERVSATLIRFRFPESREPSDAQLRIGSCMLMG